jgi:hypothetical protein
VSMSDYSMNVVDELDLSPSFYPEAQCRLDTMINGLLSLERPVCWYPQGIENGYLRN